MGPGSQAITVPKFPSKEEEPELQVSPSSQPIPASGPAQPTQATFYRVYLFSSLWSLYEMPACGLRCQTAMWRQAEGA